MIREKGIIVTWVIVFGAIFLLLLSGLLSFILLQHRQSLEKAAWHKSLHIAESGIDYARWRLIHAEDDFSFSGTKSLAGIGEYRLEISPPSGCTPAAVITSTGSTFDFPALERSVRIQYAKPSLAKYGFLTNSNVWFGPNEELNGPFHSNGGIRMDGSQNSLSTSAKETYVCGPEHGCSPAQEKPGIWGGGEGGEKGLWQYPVPAVDFDLVTQDLAALKEDAQSSGIYISQPVDHGYHIQFQPDGTIDVFRVKGLKQKVWGWNGEDWVHESNSIDSEEFVASYPLPADCSPIFVENNVWVDGIVSGRAILVAAELPEKPQKLKKIIIQNNIDYLNQDSVLGLIGQSDILIPLYSADNLEIKAAMLAQKGHVFRYYYPQWSSEPYKTYALRNNIRTYGSIISNTLWTFTWVDETEQVVSGYQSTGMDYDPNLTYSPPPYFPTAGQQEFLRWEEL